jgi:predicted  nucleic acid-binding Zn-ribbon protein
MQALEEENKKLATLLELKNRQVQAMEATLTSLRSELQKADVEMVKLRQENAALIKGISSLSPP